MNGKRYIMNVKYKWQAVANSLAASDSAA